MRRPRSHSRIQSMMGVSLVAALLLLARGGWSEELQGRTAKGTPRPKPPARPMAPQVAAPVAPRAPTVPGQPRMVASAGRGLTKGSAIPSSAGAKAAPKAAPPCFKRPVALRRGAEEVRISLTRCDGTPAPMALEQLSVLARPWTVPPPREGLAALTKKKSRDLASGVRRLDGRLLDRLQKVVDHFGGKASPRVNLISGYRPASVGSFHAHGEALDFHVDGVSNEALVAYCRTLPDTGCGYYPNSSFVHMDVRPKGTGHVAWIDGSGPGESAHYVSTWPPSPSDAPRRHSVAAHGLPMDTLDPFLGALPEDRHPTGPSVVGQAWSAAAGASEGALAGAGLEAVHGDKPEPQEPAGASSPGAGQPDPE
jgi:hypothetical protein